MSSSNPYEEFTPPADDDIDLDDDMPVVDTQTLDVDEILGATAAQNAPKETDDMFPRWAMSGLLPIPLFRQNGNNSFGDFNQKDAQGRNIANNSWYPPFRIMPLFGGTFNIPYENNLSVGDEETKPEAFDFSSFLRRPPSGFTSITRSAKQCADIFEKETGDCGTHVFDSLTGYHIADDDKGLAAVRTLVDLVLPVTRMPAGIRIKNGVPFKGPFLDELLNYVLSQSEAKVGTSNLSPADRKTAMRFVTELRERVLRRGLQMANTFLNESEAEMKSPDPNSVKHMYDVPNLEVEDAPVPTDLYCLAHTNRVELDDKQLQASANIGSEIANPMVQAVGSLKDAVEKMTAAKMPAQTGTTMTTEEVEAMLQAQEERLTTMFEERMAAAAGTEPKTKGK